MNYSRIYNQLINKRKLNPIKKDYKENHHILPKSLGGKDSKENLVYLTGREHWIAHLLLHKIHKKSQTAHACNMMAMNCEERGIPYIKNSRMYEWVRKQCISLWSDNGKKRIGEKNGSYGTMWICNIKTKKNKKITKDQQVPNGWVKGRNKWNEVIFKRECLFCGAEFETKKPTTRHCSLKCGASNKKHSDSSKQKMRNQKIGKSRPQWVKEKISTGVKRNRYKNFD
jgi:hypothetical protein